MLTGRAAGSRTRVQYSQIALNTECQSPQLTFGGRWNLPTTSVPLWIEPCLSCAQLMVACAGLKLMVAKVAIAAMARNDVFNMVDLRSGFMVSTPIGRRPLAAR